MADVYITSAGKFLPGEPVSNEQIEERLGQVRGKPSRVKRLILDRNRIQQRHYALDAERKTTHSSAQLAAAAIRDALSRSTVKPADVDLICAATTIPDMLVPGFAAMVHGELPEVGPAEILSSVSVCCAGMSALSHAWASVAVGRRTAAVSAGSEVASKYFLAEKFETLDLVKAGEPIPFEMEFLRWMISDGAGAFLLQNRPRADGLSLRIDWIDVISHAHENPVCMSSGWGPGGDYKGFMTFPDFHQAAGAGVFTLRQDLELVDKAIRYMVDDFVALVRGGRTSVDQIDFFLCHYSSHFFRGMVEKRLKELDCSVPEEKWFTNLYTRGNTGNASIYVMLEELFHSGKLRPGQKIACLVPESGRFTTAQMLLTVVDGKGTA